MVMFISEADIATSPIMTTILLTSIGAATAALAGSIRAVIWHRNLHHRKFIPVLCAFLAVIYLFMSCTYQHLDGAWLFFGLCTMIALNAILIFDTFSGSHKNAK